METLVNAVFECIWDFIAKLSIIIEDNPELSLEVGILITMIAYWARRFYRGAANSTQVKR